MPGIRRGQYGHFLLDPGGGKNQDRDDYVGWVRFCKIQPQEARVQGSSGEGEREGRHGIDFLCQPDQLFRPGEQGLHQHPEQPKQYRHLDDHGPEAADGAHTGLPVDAHSFLGNPRPVPGVPVLHLFDLGLEGAHGPHLVKLFQGQRKGDQANNDGQQDNRNAHLVAAHYVQQH